MGNFLNSLQRLWNNKLMRVFMLVIFIVLIAIIVIIIVIGGNNKSISESNLVNAAKRYLSNNSSMLPVNDYDSTTITLSMLVSNGYIKSDSDGSICNSYVTVVKIDKDYVYTPYIKCGNEHDTVLLSNNLLKNITTSGDGLYDQNGVYTFKGENPNNYVSFGETTWRIVGLDKFSNIKLIYDDSSPDYEVWDDRYNSITDDQDGINDFENSIKSRAKEYLDNYITNNSEIFTPARKAKLAKYSICTGKVDMSNVSVDSCSTTMDNALVSIITVNDYMNASIDPLCSTVNNKNCQNYNYLNKNGWTMTASTIDTVSVYSINKDNGIVLAKAYISKALRPIIALRNDVVYLSGDGTKLNPYVIK